MVFKILLYGTTALVFICGIVAAISYLSHLSGAYTSATKDYVAHNVKEIPITLGQPNNQMNLKVSTLPQFVIDLIDKKFNSLWFVHAEERKKYIDASLSNATGDENPKVEIQFDDQKKQLVITPLVENKMKPGLYSLKVMIKTDTGEDVTTTQDFTWGVMTINTSKGVYHVGETVTIGMSVLGDYGNTKCIASNKISFNTAKVWLTVTSPNGVTQTLSTDDGSIQGSKACGDRSVTNEPDFFTKLAAKEVGTYTLTMEAEQIFGKRHMEYTFNVQPTVPDFDIERITYPTRIYPRVDYPVQITIKANKDYSGVVRDFVPNNFQISDISGLGRTIHTKTVQEIQWEVNWQSGNIYTVSYTIHFPPIAPELYLVGPLTIGQFQEEHQWKIASDSIFQFIQESHNTGSGTSVSTDLPDPIGQGHLVLKICYRTNNSSFSSQSGWSSAYNNSSGPRIYMYYRVAPASMSQTVTCSTTSSGTLGVQALEFSGNSTSSVRDRRNRLNNSSTCNSVSHQNSNNNLTPGNPDVLAVSAFSATSTRTVTAHSDYTDSATSFNASSGTFDSSWGEVVNNPPINTKDAVTYNAGGGTCDNLQVTFNPQISVSQGGFRFFDNADSIDPGSPLANVNTSIQFYEHNRPFRLRVLLDIDSPSGSTIDVDSGDWQIEYAEMPTSGDCTDGDYNPVDTITNGTPIAYNPNASSGGNNSFILSSGNDPTDSGYSTALEDYIETWLNDNSEDVTNHQNTLGNNQAGLFDFSLIDNTNDFHGHTYCLAVFNGDGSPLDAYKNYPTITTPNTDVLIQGGSTIQGGTTIQ